MNDLKFQATVKSYLILRGIKTQKRLAELMNISASKMCLYLKDPESIPLGAWWEMADCLNIPYDERIAMLRDK